MFDKIKFIIYKFIRVILIIVAVFALIDPISYFLGDTSWKYNSSPFLRYVNGYNWSHSNYPTGWDFYTPAYHIVEESQIKLRCQMNSKKFNVSDSSVLFHILPDKLDLGLKASAPREKISDYFLAINIQYRTSTHGLKSEYILSYDQGLTEPVYQTVGPFSQIESGYGDFICLDHVVINKKEQKAWGDFMCIAYYDSQSKTLALLDFNKKIDPGKGKEQFADSNLDIKSGVCEPI